MQEQKPVHIRWNALVVIGMAAIVAAVASVFLALAGEYELAMGVATTFLAIPASAARDLINPDQGQVPGAIAAKLIGLIEQDRKLDASV